MYNNNYNNMGFNVGSPIVQNMMGGGGMIPPSYNMNIGGVGYNNVYAPTPMFQQPNYDYPMQQPVVNKQFDVQQPTQYIDPNNRPASFSPFTLGDSGSGYSMPNSSFYNGVFNGYYNPYMENFQRQQQAQIEAIEAKQRAEMESRIWKKMSRGFNEISKNPIENIDEHLKQYDPVDPNQYMKKVDTSKDTLRVTLVKDDEVICDPIKNGYYETQNQLVNYFGMNYNRDSDMKTMQLVNVELYGIPYNLELARRVEYNNSMFDSHKREFGDDMGLIDYLNNAGILYSNALVYENMMRRYDLSQSYNQNNFRNALLGGQSIQDKYYSQAFSMPSEYTGIYPGPTLGSLEVTVPNRIRNKYEERRAQFLNSIMSH